MNLDPRIEPRTLSVQSETDNPLCRSSDITPEAILAYAKKFSTGLPQETSLEAVENLSASSTKMVRAFDDAFEQVLLTQAYLLTLEEMELAQFCKTELKRQRAPKKGTHATLAVAYVFRNAKSTSRGLHSQWASKAIFAVANQIAPDEAAEKMKNVTLRECRAKAAEYMKILYASPKPWQPRSATSITFTQEIRGLTLDFTIAEKQFHALKEGRLAAVGWKSVRLADPVETRVPDPEVIEKAGFQE